MRHPVSRLRARVLAAGLALAAATLVPTGSAGAADEYEYEWAALGDSYTAGVFVGDPQPGLGDVGRDGCDRTSDAYPYLIERRLADYPPGRPVRLTNVSCGAATIADVSTAKQTPISPVEPPAGGWAEVDQQIERAKLSQQTDVVTVGVGGNSLPFGEMLFKCIELGLGGQSCRDYYTNPPEGVKSIKERLAQIEGEYIEMLANVHTVAPFAKVITVGYPAILPQDAADCGQSDLTELGPISPADIDWLRTDVLEAQNATIQRVSGFFGDRYADVYSSSVGHDVCQAPDTKWVEGLCGDAADYWPSELPGGVFDCAAVDKRATLVHPNAAGHENTAHHVERAVRIALLER
ncbi:Lipase 2 [Streptomyces sp. RB5]|uniref:Lipase 2 n=1 Tax=Streptomyces smaragdinus TaxID=2585196 RepID=A0A7K0CQL3_9ACTN|nr:SGNH/GDSL hydrolase family protein [Streptomyces smaragdinus]MQY15775.1 Lipase 2 [Streptomyces smaragdinus]